MTTFMHMEGEVVDEHALTVVGQHSHPYTVGASSTIEPLRFCSTRFSLD